MLHGHIKARLCRMTCDLLKGVREGLHACACTQ